jgi:hypothetical protein
MSRPAQAHRVLTFHNRIQLRISPSRVKVIAGAWTHPADCRHCEGKRKPTDADKLLASLTEAWLNGTPIRIEAWGDTFELNAGPEPRIV